MRSTVLYRPHTEEETSCLIESTLEVLVDARVDGVVYGALRQWGWKPRERHLQCDANDLRSALRHLLPSDGFGEPDFRMHYGWTRDEIMKIIALLRLSVESMKGAATTTAISGTAQTLMRDAVKMDRIVERWSVGVVPPTNSMTLSEKGEAPATGLVTGASCTG